MIPAYLNLPAIRPASGDFVLRYDGDGAFEIFGPVVDADARSFTFREPRHAGRHKDFTFPLRGALFAGPRNICDALRNKLHTAMREEREARAAAQEVFALAIEAAVAAAHGLCAEEGANAG